MAERAGVPAIAVMTTQFVSAADLMSRVLGLPDYGFAVIDHPISSASDEGLYARAQATVERSVSFLLTTSSDIPTIRRR
jgi:hypothetical protein